VAAGWKSEVWRRGCSRERDGAAAADGEDRGSVAAGAAVEETLLPGEASLAASLWGLREGRGERRGFCFFAGKMEIFGQQLFWAKREEVQIGVVALVRPRGKMTRRWGEWLETSCFGQGMGPVGFFGGGGSGRWLKGKDDLGSVFLITGGARPLNVFFLKERRGLQLLSVL